MCVIDNLSWRPCAHQSQRIHRCELAYPLAESDWGSQSDGSLCPSCKACWAPHIDETGLPGCPDEETRLYIHRLPAKHMHPQCPIGRDCLPAAKSCCQCQSLPSPGAQGSQGSRGGAFQNCDNRLARFASSFTARHQYEILCIGDGCVGNLYEEDRLKVVVEIDEAARLEMLVLCDNDSKYVSEGECNNNNHKINHDNAPMQWNETDPMQDVVYHEPGMGSASVVDVQYSSLMDVDEDYCGTGAPAAVVGTDVDTTTVSGAKTQAVAILGPV